MLCLNIILSNLFIPQIEKSLNHDKLTCLSTEIHGQSVRHQVYHCWQPRKSAAMLVEGSPSLA